MFRKFIAAMVMMSFAILAFASPTPKQVEDALAANHLGEAKVMIAQVIAEHPTSARAHLLNAYVLAANDHNAVAANTELNLVRSLDKKGDVVNSALFGRTVGVISSLPSAKQPVQQAAPVAMALPAMPAPAPLPPAQHESHGFLFFMLILLFVIAAIYAIRHFFVSTVTHVHYNATPSYTGNNMSTVYTPSTSSYPTSYNVPSSGVGVGTAVAAGAVAGVAGAVIAEELIHRNDYQRGYYPSQGYNNTTMSSQSTPTPYQPTESIISTENERASFSSGSSSDWDDRSSSSSSSYSSSSDSGSSWDSGSSSSSDSSSSGSDW